MVFVDKDGWAINELPLSSPIVTTLMVHNVSKIFNCCFHRLMCFCSFLYTKRIVSLANTTFSNVVLP